MSSHRPTDQDVSSHDLAWGLVSTRTFFLSMDPPSYNNGTELHPSQHSDGASSSKRAGESPPSPANFNVIGKYFQNQFGKSIGSNKSEDFRFWAYFGCGAEVAVKVWDALVHFAILPDQGQILHLLVVLYFMKWYPTEETAWAAAGGHTWAINPKTHQIYIWPFIWSLML